MYSNAITYAVLNLRLILVVEAASIDDSALAIDAYSQGPLDCAFLKKKKGFALAGVFPETENRRRTSVSPRGRDRQLLSRI